MITPARVTVLIASILFSTFASAQYFQPMMRPGGALQAGSINGTVLGPSGEPLTGIRVELRNVGSALPVASTYTEPGGTFEMYNIPAGSYQIVAYANNLEARDAVSVSFGGYDIQLRMPQNADAAYGSASTVSVAQLKVPRKAWQYYSKARQAFVKSKDEEAAKQIEKALQVYPHFAEALTLRGLLEGKHNSGDRGQQDFEASIQADPHYSVAYLALGSLYNGQARFDDALRTLEEGVTLSPNAWQGYFEMARAAIAKGMYAKGLQLASKAESLGGSSFAAIHLMKAYAMIPLKFYKGAQQELQAFLAREPKGKNAERAQILLAKVTAAETATAQTR